MCTSQKLIEHMLCDNGTTLSLRLHVGNNTFNVHVFVFFSFVPASCVLSRNYNQVPLTPAPPLLVLVLLWNAASFSNMNVAKHLPQ